MTTPRSLPIVPTAAPPERESRLIHDFTPQLIDVGEHHLCPGCGEPIAMRSIVEAVAEADAIDRSVGVFGIGCYTAFSNNLDVEVVQALHGRAPSLATGVKRARPDLLVFTVQGDGDMVDEGLQEVVHAAARGERITCFMLNNGVFGETGGHMTATTVLGQRTKTSLEGRDAATHGHPIDVGRLLAQIEGAAYVARGAVNSPGLIARTKRMIHRALELQMAGAGFTFVEVLTMCPTGWFVPTSDGPAYLEDAMMETFGIGELKAPPAN
jgi:2-oxoglutarate/2-oxoacid ferredoxin oxidoreductase subunit beta